jgi:Zn finger protein HypA/HybF involved in hydrogenase expression
MQSLRNRVKEVRRLKASEVSANPKNFRLHNDHQRQQFRSILGEVGFSGVSLAYYSARNGGRLTLLDGHMRNEEVAPDFESDFAILDVNDEEADKILLSFDWIGSLATIDEEKIRQLTAEITTQTEAAKATVAAIVQRYAEEVAPETFPEYNEDVATDHQCPKCGYKWSGSTE